MVLPINPGGIPDWSKLTDWSRLFGLAGLGSTSQPRAPTQGAPQYDYGTGGEVGPYGGFASPDARNRITAALMSNANPPPMLPGSTQMPGSDMGGLQQLGMMGNMPQPSAPTPMPPAAGGSPYPAMMGPPGGMPAGTATPATPATPGMMGTPAMPATPAQPSLLQQLRMSGR